MKNSIFSLIFLIAIGCNSSEKVTPTMPGTYYMQSQTISDGTQDTKYTQLKQLKIYTDDYFMYVQVNPSDSFSAFGVGSYVADTGSVIENVILSVSDTTFNNTPQAFNLIINQTRDGYEQIIPEITFNTQKYKLTEVYEKVKDKPDSKLDGVWKEINSYTLVNGDTIKNTRTQYKAFYDGYFMFGHTFLDSTSNRQTGIGFGTFEMINDNKIVETDLNSTYSIIAGQTFDVDIEMDGEDHFKQVVYNKDGSKGVEFYERIKK